MYKTIHKKNNVHVLYEKQQCTIKKIISSHYYLPQFHNFAPPNKFFVCVIFQACYFF